MSNPLAQISTRKTPQNQKAPDRPDQVFNNAGGAVFEVDDQTRLRRFLTLGSEASFYNGAAELSRDNADVVFRMAEKDPWVLIQEIYDVSTKGLAPKQDQTLFALAIAASHGDAETKRAALELLPQICRTGTHLFQFVGYAEQFRGWGRMLKRAVANWYLDKPVDDVAFQAVKYRQRGGWSQRDLLRLSKPRVVESDAKRAALFEWVARGGVGEDTPRIVEGFVKAQETGANLPALIGEYRLSWEMLPSEALNDVKVWDALLNNGIPAMALMRQLPRLTNLGMFPLIGGRTAEVAALLQDAERLKRARVHPINVLVAQRTYQSGVSFRGDSRWTPNAKIVDALDAGFYAAFGAVQPANKRTLLALDVSGSMMARIANSPLSAREASAAMALVQMSTEKDAGCVGFTSGGGRGYSRSNAVLTPLSISPRQRLDDAIRTVSGLPFGGTDCALPMVVATQQKLAVDTFVVYTDNETWHGAIHPYQALRDYREKTGIDARLVVVGMTATRFSIADPSDPGMLDVAGFDASAPNLISAFSRGEF